jgi:uncharacterized protein (TIGR03067 family)
MQGTWTVVSIEVNGQKLPQDKVGDAQAVIQEDHYTLHDFRLTFKLDPSKNPPTIDMQGKTGRNEPLTMIGIYELDGDTLRICFAKPSIKDRPPETDRPKEFKTMPGTGASLIIYQRKKQ